MATREAPDLLSAALIERDGAVLTAHRAPGKRPFAGQWLLPLTIVGGDETAEDALRRHAREHFDVAVAGESFVETVYMEDPVDQRRYVANIFRADTAGRALRLRAGGDYDDARWLRAAELAAIGMPEAMREPLARIATGPPGTPAEPGSAAGVQASTPLAERAEEPPVVEVAPPPDNRAGWDTIAAAYQEERYGERDIGRLRWSDGVFEDEVQLLEDVRGRRAIVLGCGGGQDCVALERMGATAVGIDFSPAQIVYAKKFAQRHGAGNSSFVEGSIDDLSRFDDESFDIAISIRVLPYVQDAASVMREAARVLRSGGVIAIAVPHPFGECVTDESPYAVYTSYWTDRADWDFSFESSVSARFRDWLRPVSEWVNMLIDAGFVIERVAEPRRGAGFVAVTARDEQLVAKNAYVPEVLIIKGTKR